jgi:NADH-quinone oxidoreductase subunit L
MVGDPGSLQDGRNMGGSRRYMPITYLTALLGSLALIGFPGFSGFFSKDAIIEAVHLATRPGSGYAYVLLTAGVFVTALYSFRMFFLVFHGDGPRDAHARHHLHESPAVVTVPLILLAIPSVVIGYLTVGDMLFGDFFKGALTVLPQNDVLAAMGKDYHGAAPFILHGMAGLPFYLAMAGLLVAGYIYLFNVALADRIKDRLAVVYRVLDKKYGFDEFNQAVFAGGSRAIGRALWQGGDRAVIDGVIVDGSAHAVGWLAGIVRHLQTGYLYHYAIAMVVGLIGLLAWFVMP